MSRKTIKKSINNVLNGIWIEVLDSTFRSQDWFHFKVAINYLDLMSNDTINQLITAPRHSNQTDSHPMIVQELRRHLTH